MKYTLITLCFLLIGISSRVAAQPDWAGTWTGTLINLPVRSDAPQVEVTREIGTLPTEPDTCTLWQTSYAEGGEVQQVKDYQLCRGQDENDWYIDEGDGIVLTGRWIGDVLVTPFKYNDILLVTSTRLRDDVMEEEILTVGDQPAIEGVQPMSPRGIQRLVLHRKN